MLSESGCFLENGVYSFLKKFVALRNEKKRLTQSNLLCADLSGLLSLRQKNIRLRKIRNGVDRRLFISALISAFFFLCA